MTGPLGDVEAEAVAQGTSGDEQFVLQRVTIRPGGETTWHRHHGVQFVIVAAGHVVRDSLHCDQLRARQGDAFVEKPGDVHIGRNLGDEPTVLWVMSIVPRGSQIAVAADVHVTPER